MSADGDPDDRHARRTPDMTDDYSRRTLAVPTPWGPVTIRAVRKPDHRSHVAVYLPDGDD